MIILVKNMNFNFVVTRQYLLKSHTNFTITNLANKIDKSIYQVKHGLLSKYLTDQLKHPSIKMKVI